jgi:aspartate kinase
VLDPRLEVHGARTQYGPRRRRGLGAERGVLRREGVSRLIIQKFGGTSVEDAAALARLTEVVAHARAEQPIVVVSAMGKTTNRLAEALDLAVAGNGPAARQILARLKQDTSTIVSDANPGDSGAASAEIEPFFEELESMAQAIAVLKSVPADARDHFLAQGELIASVVVARVLLRAGIPAVRVDARDALATDDRFGRAAPDFETTRMWAGERLRAPASAGKVPVVGGFVGRSPGGHTTVLGRGGSDYSAAIFGACLDAERVEIWTDVDGMMTADPRIVPEARVLDRISAEEASELAYFGARVLHPLTLAPAIEKGIPVRIRNSRRPDRSGTDILPAAPAGDDEVRSIACKRGIATVDVVTTRMLMASGFLRTLFEVFAKYDTAVDMVTTSEISVSVTVDDLTRIKEVRRDLEKMAKVEIATDRAIVCLVGQNLKYTPGIAGRIFGVLDDVNVLMISQGASRRNVSFVVEGADVENVVCRLHRAFFEDGKGKHADSAAAPAATGRGA